MIIHRDPFKKSTRYPTRSMTGLALLFLTAYLLIVLIGSAVIVFQIVRPRRRTFARALAKGLPTDPADLELKAEDVTFNLPGNHTTPGWIIQGQQPDAPAAIVLHGHGDSIYGALRFAQHLTPHTSRVVVFDWPGHGGCSARWMTCGIREPDDALAVLDGLPEPHRNNGVVLFGYSLGGQIAIKTAAQHPRFVGVIVDGAYRRWDTPIRRRLKVLGVPPIPMVQVVGAAFHLAGLIRRFDRARYAAQLEAPLLVLHGTEDRICPIHEGKDLADAAPNSTFVAIDGGRHNRLHEHEPDAYHAALKNFFDTLQS